MFPSALHSLLPQVNVAPLETPNNSSLNQLRVCSEVFWSLTSCVIENSHKLIINYSKSTLAVRKKLLAQGLATQVHLKPVHHQHEAHLQAVCPYCFYDPTKSSPLGIGHGWYEVQTSQTNKLSSQLPTSIQRFRWNFLQHIQHHVNSHIK